MARKTHARKRKWGWSTIDLLEALERRELLAAHILGSSTSYSTIQAAVNAATPGAVITVDAGTYSETVTITKSLTLRGAQADVDARLNTRTASGSESIVNGQLNTDGTRSGGFLIKANDVTIDGFTVTGNTNGSGAVPAGIVMAPSIAGTHIFDNVISSNVTGLYLSNNSSTDAAVIQHNLFSNNNYNSGPNSGRGIYTDGGVSGGKLTNVLIDSNAFVVTSFFTGSSPYQGAIALESRTANSQSNITINNNLFDGNGKVLAYNADHITETYNVVTHCLDQWSCGFRFEGGDTNVTIKYNTVFDNTGPGICVDSHGFPADDGNFDVEYNNFYNNDTAYNVKYSMAVQGDVFFGTFNAEHNWWGDPSGPGGQGPGKGDWAYGDAAYGSSTTSWTTVPGSELDLSNWATAPIGALDTAYRGLASAAGANIQAEDYDQGGEGVGYHDTTKGNSLGKYRTGESVDIEASTDTGGGFDVGSTVAGEYLDYAISLASTGKYNLAFRVANGQTTASTFQLNIDGTNVSGTVNAAPTGGWQKWTTVNVSNVSLTAGQHIARLLVLTNGKSGGGPNFNWFSLTPVSAPPAAATDLTANALSATQVSLFWGVTAVAGTQTSQQVQRSTDGVNFTTVATLSATANFYTDASAAAGTTCTYRIVGVGAGGTNGGSNTATATTLSAGTLPQYLSDLSWTSATAGFGTVQKDKSINGNAITLNGTIYPKGLGTHASSTIVYALGGQYSTFASDVGIDAEEDGKGTGSVDFQVIGDGVTLFDSGILTNDIVKHVNISVAGVKTLQLIAANGLAGSIDFDHADWAGAAVYGTPTAPLAPTGLLATLAANNTTATLTWTPGSANQSGFTIQRSTDGTTFSTIGTTTATSYTDAGPLAAGATYTYRILATNAQGTSAPSNTAAVTTPASGTVTVSVSDMTPTSATTGYGSVMKDKTVNGNPITLNGVVYTKGVGVHAVSTLTYALGGQYTTFTSDVGVDDEENGKGVGSVIFQVIGDGVMLYTSGVRNNGTAPAHVGVSVAGVQQLQLVATNGVAGSIDYDHADWAGATLVGTPTAPGVPTNLAASAVTATSVKLTWTAPGTNVNTYAVDRSTDNVTFTTISSTIPGTATTWVDPTALTASTLYYYRSRAINAAGTSPNSVVATVTTPAQQTVTYLSDLAWTSATAGFGTVQKDKSINGNPITLNGVVYSKGIGTHASSTITYNLAGAYTTFVSTVGIDDEENGKGIGHADFQVWGDGVLLFDSGLLSNGQTANIAINITGVTTLTLIAAPGPDGNIDYAHADWAGAQVLA